MSRPRKAKAPEREEAVTEETVAEAPVAEEVSTEEVSTEEVSAEPAPVIEAPVAEAPAEPALKGEEKARQEMKALLRNAVKSPCRPTLLRFDQRSGLPRNALIELDSKDVEKLWGIWREACGSADQEGFVTVLTELMGQYPARIMRVASPLTLGQRGP